MGISELIQFNNPSDYSTLKSFIDYYRDNWIFNFTYLNKIIEDGKTALPKQNICQSPIDEMIKLFEKQLEYIETIKQIFKELERSKIYKMDIKLSTNLLPEIGQNMRQLNIFLCHSSGDKENVRNLYKFLISKGFNPWLDEENLLAGQDWKLEINKAVKKSDVVVVCLSPESIKKDGYVNKEIKFSLDVADEKPEGEVFIVPIKLVECTLPERLSHLQAINIDSEEGMCSLIKSLSNISVK